MALFDWFSGVKGAPPADPRPPLSAPVGGYSLLAPFWPEAESAAPFAQSYACQIRAAYERNAIAQRAVRIVADGVGGAPVTANDARLLALIKATSAGQSLLETVAAHLALHGNAYVRVLAAADGAPVELIALRPERVRVQAGADGWPIAYVYGEGDGAEIYPVAHSGFGGPDALPDIIHIKAFHPSDDLIGMGCLGAAGEAIAVHNAAARWNRALLDNGAQFFGYMAEGRMLMPLADPVTIPDARVISLNGGAQDDAMAAVQAAPIPPAPLALRYYDPARDYQIALQRSRTGDHARGVQSVDVPAAMTADAAYALAEGMAQRGGGAAQSLERILPEYLADTLPVGAQFAITGAGSLWHVTEREWLNGAVRITAQPARGAVPIGASGAAGLGPVAGLGTSGETRLVALELPPISSQTPAALLVAAGSSAGWRGAMAYNNAGGVDAALGWIARGAVMGALAADLPAHNGLLADSGALTVELLHADMALPIAGNAAAPPLIWVAGEVLSYTHATPESATRWRLTGLTRALYNSAAPAKASGARVVLLEGDMPHWPIDTTSLPFGHAMAFTAEGAGDDASATAALTLTHLAKRPPAPVHGRVVKEGGAITLHWHRRTRAVHLWQDYADAPLGESVERYRVAFVGSTAPAPIPPIETATPTLTLAQLPAGATAADIRQIGDFGASDPLIIAL